MARFITTFVGVGVRETFPRPEMVNAKSLEIYLGIAKVKKVTLLRRGGDAII